MAQFYEMPAVSPTMELGTLVAWRVAEGESFKPQTVMAEVGTDKANMDAEIFDAGVLIKHLIAEGDEVPAGFPIAIIGQSADEDITALLKAFEDHKQTLGKSAAKDDAAPQGDSAPSAAEADSAPPTDAPADAPTTERSRPAPRAPIHREWEGRRLAPVFMDPPGDIGAATTEDRIAASPLARKIAADRGVDLRRVTGSGPGGRIVKDDVLHARSRTGAPAVRRTSETVRNSPMRKTIATRLLESHQEIPTFYLTIDLDTDRLVDLREQLKIHEPDAKVSFNDLVIKAAGRALADYPKVNATWSATEITRHGNIDIGVAVALPDGLITPVVRNADQLSPAEINQQVRELAQLARDGKLKPEQYQGNTFTISNLGMMGIEEFTAIINPPASAILAVGAMRKVPVVGADGQVRVASRMKVTMTCDHRVIDGATGAEFLAIFRKYIEAPAALLG